MTNTLAVIVVTLVTNLTETFPHMSVPAPNTGPPGNLLYYSQAVPVPNPTQKWVTVSIVEVATVTNLWNGEPVVGKKERPITNWTEHYVLVPPPPPPPPKWERSTNNAPIPMYWPHGGFQNAWSLK